MRMAAPPGHHSSSGGVNKMKRWMGRVAMVTGVVNSTGRAVAEALAREGMIVLGVDDHHDLEKLELLVETLKMEQALGSFHVCRCDIKSMESVKKLFMTWKQDPDIEGIDVVVHCGVVAMGESILEGNPAVWKEMLETNILAPAFITQEVFKSMKDRGIDDGHIIFDNGLCSHRLLPGNRNLHFLSATKHACRAMVEGLRFELKMENTHCRVSAISAGVIETDILDKVFQGDETHAKTFLGDKKFLDVKDVAATVVFILEQPPHVQIHDVLLRATAQVP